MTLIANENELVASRVMNAPQEHVFRAWTDPALLTRWWGPHGFTSTFHEFDLRPGGNWRFTFHGPNGVDYPNHNVFVEIVPSERVVIDHPMDHPFQVTGLFEDLGGGSTRVTFRQQFKNAEDYEKLKAMCSQANEENMDRLSDVLAGLTS